MVYYYCDTCEDYRDCIKVNNLKIANPYERALHPDIHYVVSEATNYGWTLLPIDKIRGVLGTRQCIHYRKKKVIQW